MCLPPHALRARPGEDASKPQQLAFQAAREVRHTVIRVITAHLRRDAASSWQGLNFDYTGVVYGQHVVNTASPLDCV
jgi:hypothetical protein